MPHNVLYLLAAIPVLFFIYSGTCYLKLGKNWRPFLQAIAVANLLYCFVSIGFLIRHFKELTNLGVTYFVAEVCVVVALGAVEFVTAARK